MEEMQAITVLLVDHHALIGSGLTLLLGTYPEFEVIGQARGRDDALKLLQYQGTDVVVIDVDMPGPTSGTETIAAMRQASPYTKIVVLTNLVDRGTIQASLRAGAMSYMLKNISSEELARAIRAAKRGMPMLSPEVTLTMIQQAMAPMHLMRSLTAREQEVLELMARGWNNRQIGSELNISLSTVQYHVSNILSKLDVHNRTEAAAFALRHQARPS
jgi:NarL family two-component system response regulator LiaR